MLMESDRKKMAAAILEGQESAYSLERAIGADPTLAARHLQTILHSFSICHSLLNSQSQSSCPPTNKKRKRKSYGEEELISDSPTLIIDDGFSWRKYGQKYIKNSHHQRSYYRCMGSNCKARKHVQKIEDSPSIYRTTYVGLHMCQTDLFLHSAHNNGSSTMIHFDQPPNEHQDTNQVMHQEYCDDQELLLNDDNFWVSNELEMMFAHNDYDLDPFQV